MRIGLLYLGDEIETIWGSNITTYYLGQAFKQLGHDVWRVSLDNPSINWAPLLKQRTQMVIAEGIPFEKITPELRDQCDFIVQWWLTTLFYDEHQIISAPFDAIATNSEEWFLKLKELGVMTQKIELAAPFSFSISPTSPNYSCFSTYLGYYPLKTKEQMDLLFEPAKNFGLDIWGAGWEESPYRPNYRGILPLEDIGCLYRSANIVLALTETKQRDLGMINNRIFEALMAGAVVISDQHPSFSTHEIGQFINVVKNKDEVQSIMQKVLESQELQIKASFGQEFVAKKHTYFQRARDFLNLYQSLLFKKRQSKSGNSEVK